MRWQTGSSPRLPTLRASQQRTAGGREALWVDGPHHIVGIDGDGRELTATARAAGPTLIFRANDLTLRLEGADRERAIDIARSVAGT